VAYFHKKGTQILISARRPILRPDFERTYPLQPTYPARRRVISANQFHLSSLLQVGTGAGGGTSRCLITFFATRNTNFIPLFCMVLLPSPWVSSTRSFISWERNIRRMSFGPKIGKASVCLSFPFAQRKNRKTSLPQEGEGGAERDQKGDCCCSLHTPSSNILGKMSFFRMSEGREEDN